MRIDKNIIAKNGHFNAYENILFLHSYFENPPQRLNRAFCEREKQVKDAIDWVKQEFLETESGHAILILKIKPRNSALTNKLFLYYSSSTVKIKTVKL